MDNVDNYFRSKYPFVCDMIQSLREDHFHNKSPLEGACFQTPSQTVVVSNLLKNFPNVLILSDFLAKADMAGYIKYIELSLGMLVLVDAGFFGNGK